MTTESTDTATQKQIKKAEAFRDLHKPGKPIILYNIWDAGSAIVVAGTGAKAIATSSWAIAKTHGFDDGEHIPLELVLQNLRRIVAAVDLPVTLDFESGYGEEPEKVARSLSLAIQAGAVGCNFEDSVSGKGTIRDTDTQVRRIKAGRKAAEALGVPFFINARCDLFFQGEKAPHDQKLLTQTVDRARAYAEAGASGFFVPGLKDTSLIAALAERSPVPINILAGPQTSLQSLADSGVARVSYGAAPYRELASALEKAAHAAVL